jgi:Zn-dependent protease
MTFGIVLFGWLFSLCLHEFSHALVAYYGGDYTVREKGYLTFNPFKYTHPLFSLVLPMLFLLMGGIGLPGGAVYIERRLIRSKFWLSAMSLAGPMSNLLLAIILGVILRFSQTSNSGIWPGLSFLLALQVSALFLNLIPLPPFDGYHVLEPFIDPVIREKIDLLGSVSIWIIFLLFWTVPAFSDYFWNEVYKFSTILGVDWSLVVVGLQRFRSFLPRN